MTRWVSTVRKPATAFLGIHPDDPFGRIGSWTLSQ